MSQSDGFFSQVEVCQYSKETEASHPRGGGTEARLVPRHGAVISHDAEAQTWKQQQQQKNIKLEIITEQRTLGSSPPPVRLWRLGFSWLFYQAYDGWLSVPLCIGCRLRTSLELVIDFWSILTQALKWFRWTTGTFEHTERGLIKFGSQDPILHLFSDLYFPMLDTRGAASHVLIIPKTL